jgi:atypical dual specificity phosphatase
MSSWWIDEPFILASSCPTDDVLKNLYQENFRIVISLLHEAEQPPFYDPAMISTIGYKRYNIPISERGFPTNRQVETFLKVIQNRDPEEKVIVHCMHGNKRTKTMAAAYLISQGLAEETVVNRLYLNK